MYRRFALSLFLISIQSAHGATTSPAQSRYGELCSGCHGAEIASAFRNAESVRNGIDATVRVIREGRPARGMPAFGRMLSEPELNAIATLLNERTTAQSTSHVGSMVGKSVEAEALRTDRSAGYSLSENASDRFVMYVDRGSHLCYDEIDLTGIKSIEYRYAKGEGEPPRRFAVVAFSGRDFDSATRINLGEKVTQLTGGWETFRTERIGLSRQVEGRYRLCFIGMEGGGVFNLDKFTLSDQPGQNDGTTTNFDLSHDVLGAAGRSFRLEKVGEIAGELWSMDFLDDGSIIAAEKSGSLWLFRNGERIGPIEGTPKVWFVGQGGLHTVQAHPDYASNRWIYLSYADPISQGSMTAIVRGRVQGNKWVDEQGIYKAPANFYVNSEAHYGSRFAFAGEYLYFSIGDRGQQDKAQDLTNPYGKIHRIFVDGRIPKDNPFVGKQTALPTIWSYGHRNPQGLTVHPQTGELWATEHGPRGGDELNLILKGANYGWPVVTFGTNYDGTIVSNETHKAGIEPPKRHWTPSIGVSGLRFFTGSSFPNWRNRLLVASLARQELRLLRIESNQVVNEEVVLEDMGRIRDVSVSPDGNPHVVLNFPNGMILRLAPK